MWDNGYRRVILQAWNSGYKMTKNLATAINKAKAIGFWIDLYVFQCANCSGNSPASSVQKQLASYLKENGVFHKIEWMWIDVEKCYSVSKTFVSAGISPL